MPPRVGSSILAAAVAVVAVAALWPAAIAGQGAVYQAPRLMGTANPDLNGIWQAMVTANWNVEDHSVEFGPYHTLLGTWGAQPAGQSVIVGRGTIPYQDWALDKRRENFETRLSVDPDELSTRADPEAKCMMPGIPRATYLPFPFQIIQTREQDPRRLPVQRRQAHHPHGEPPGGPDRLLDGLVQRPLGG